jgi:hypothetical protein
MAEEDRLTCELRVPAAVGPKERWVVFRTTLTRYRPNDLEARWGRGAR